MARIDRGFAFDGLPDKCYDLLLGTGTAAYARCAREVDDTLFVVGNHPETRRTAARHVKDEVIETIAYHGIRVHDMLRSGLTPEHVDFVTLRPGDDDFTIVPVPLRPRNDTTAKSIYSTHMEAYMGVAGLQRPIGFQEALRVSLR